MEAGRGTVDERTSRRRENLQENHHGKDIEGEKMKERILVVEGWKFWVVFILLGLMLLLAIVGVLAIIIGVVDIWPRIQGEPMKVRIP
jgi:hypothetical protein